MLILAIGLLWPALSLPRSPPDLPAYSLIFCHLRFKSSVRIKCYYFRFYQPWSCLCSSDRATLILILLRRARSRRTLRDRQNRRVICALNSLSNATECLLEPPPCSHSLPRAGASTHPRPGGASAAVRGRDPGVLSRLQPAHCRSQGLCSKAEGGGTQILFLGFLRS